MFLLNAIQHKFKDIDGSSVAFVFFNVKETRSYGH